MTFRNSKGALPMPLSSALTFPSFTAILRIMRRASRVYHDRLILYGCGDFLNDYEGIQGYEAYRGDLALTYFADIEPASRNLAAFEIIPLQIRKFRLVRPSDPDINWVRQMLDRESRRFKTSVVMIA